jgi:hypothetical protein
MIQEDVFDVTVFSADEDETENKFSSWVYAWYEDYYVPSHIPLNGVAKYTDSDVLEKLKKWIDYYDEAEEEVDYEFYEAELKDRLMPDDKIAYGVYDSTDCEYMEDLEDLDGCLDFIPGFRDK